MRSMLVRERAGRHGLALALDVAEGVGDWVADERKVKQVVVNLLSQRREVHAGRRHA